MEKESTTAAAGTMLFAGEAWFDAIETGLRERVRGFIEDLMKVRRTWPMRRARSPRPRGNGSVTSTSSHPAAAGRSQTLPLPLRSTS